MTLGERVVVMKDGVIQQCGSPPQVYGRPANRFVAGFVGMPPMNFFEGALLAEDGRLWFDEGTGRVALPRWAAQSLEARVGSRVTLGVRPQAMLDAPADADGAKDCSLEMKVDVIEFLGDKLELHVSTARHPHLIAHLDPRGRRIEPREVRRMYFDPDRLHFFEPDATGTALAAHPAA